MGLNGVALRVAFKKGIAREVKYFMTAEEAKGRIKLLFLDKDVAVMWVGAQRQHELKICAIVDHLSDNRNHGSIVCKDDKFYVNESYLAKISSWCGKDIRTKLCEGIFCLTWLLTYLKISVSIKNNIKNPVKRGFKKQENSIQ